MKKLLITVAILAIGAVSAHADSAFEGLYAGVEGGFGHTSPDVGNKDSAFSGGAYAGYGLTFDKFYLGAEAGIGLNGTEFSSGGVTYSREFQYGATAKAGYVVTPKHLVYGLVGYERAEVKADDGVTVAKGTNDGIRFGAGTETFVAKNVTARSEVSYTDWRGKGGLPDSGEWKGTVGLGVRF